MSSSAFLLSALVVLSIIMQAHSQDKNVRVGPVVRVPAQVNKSVSVSESHSSNVDTFFNEEGGDGSSGMWLADLPTPSTPPAVRKPKIEAAAAVWLTRNGEKEWKYLLFTGDKILEYTQLDFANIFNIPTVHFISEKFPGYPQRTPVDAVTVHPSGDGVVIIRDGQSFVYTDVNSHRPKKVSETPLSDALKHNCRGLMTDLTPQIDAIVDHDNDWSTCIFIKGRTVHHNLARWEKRSIVDTLAMFLKYHPISASMAIDQGRIILFDGNRFAVLTVKEHGGFWDDLSSVVYKVGDFREANGAYTEDEAANEGEE